MKESSGFKESASFGNSGTCMLEELFLSLSMGHLCEFFYLGENWACAFLNVYVQLLLALIAKFIKYTLHYCVRASSTADPTAVYL